VTVETSDGQKQYKQFITSQGLGSDQGRDMIFGIGTNETVTSVSVQFQNGELKTITAPENGTLLSIESR